MPRKIPAPPKGYKWPGEMLAVSDLIPNEDNPRSIRESKFKALVRSVQGAPWMLYMRPVILNVDGAIIGGNQRAKACQAAGYTHIPVLRFENLTPDQVAEFIIKDNVQSGEWDTDALANSFEAETLMDWGLNLGVMDFGPDEPVPAQAETTSPEMMGTDGEEDPDAQMEEAYSERTEGVVDLRTGELKFPLAIICNKIQKLHWEQIKDQLETRRDTEAFVRLLGILSKVDVRTIAPPEE